MHLMLTASPPFAAATREQMIKRRLSEEAPHIQHLDPGLPDSLDRIVNRLLARSPGDRYGSAAEVRDALAGTHARRLDVEGMVRSSKPTPRSAPTQAFESAALAPTEQTETARRPRRRQAMLAAGVIVLIGGAFAVRDGGSGDAAANVSNGGTPATVTPAPVVAPPPAVVPTKPLVVVDSATRARRLAERQRRDSIRAATKAATVAAAAVASAPGSVEHAINRYARGIESMSVDRLKEAYPGLTEEQQKRWETTFAKATKIKASVADIRTTSIDSDDAEVDFRLNTTLDYPDGQPASQPQRLHATLKRTPTGWQILSIH